MPDMSKTLLKAKEYIKTSKEIQPSNRKHILSFVEQLSAEGISKGRQIKYIYNLKRIAILLGKDFSKANKQDIVKLGSKINNNDNWTDWTKHDFIVVTKRFYKWLRNTDEFPPEVKWLKPNMRRSTKKLPKELLTIEEVKQLAEHTNNLRDRCIVLVLYESGARIGELLNIRIKDVEFDKYGALINLFGKTGARKVRIIASAPSISNWMLEHPFKDDKNRFLFCGLWARNRGNELGYRHVNKLLKEIGMKAGIDKPMNPHHFRHSRATELAKRLTEAQLCQYLGWVQGSQEASIYVHLSGRDSDKAILEMHGLISEKDEKSRFKPIKCPRCGVENDPAAKFCSQCSLGLELTSVMDYEKSSKEALKTVEDMDTLTSLVETIKALKEKVDRLEKTR